jgi:hypothetical protein
MAAALVAAGVRPWSAASATENDALAFGSGSLEGALSALGATLEPSPEIRLTVPDFVENGAVVLGESHRNSFTPSTLCDRVLSMGIEKSEAVVTLAAIDAAAARSVQLQRYRRFAPFMILWGAIWLLANGASEVAPNHSGTIWLSLTLLGVTVSYWLGWRQHASFDRDTARAGQGWRWLLCLLVIFAFQATAIAVLPTADGRQQDTFFSMFWTFLYMAIGAWAGWRLFAIGLAATLLILLGYYGVHSHYFLYMGCVSGGALMTGGLWLRKL